MEKTEENTTREVTSPHFSSSFPALFPAVVEMNSRKSLLLDHSWTGLTQLPSITLHPITLKGPTRLCLVQSTHMITPPSSPFPITFHYCNIHTHIQQLLSVTQAGSRWVWWANEHWQHFPTFFFAVQLHWLVESLPENRWGLKNPRCTLSRAWWFPEQTSGVWRK